MPQRCRQLVAVVTTTPWRCLMVCWLMPRNEVAGQRIKYENMPIETQPLRCTWPLVRRQERQEAGREEGVGTQGMGKGGGHAQQNVTPQLRSTFCSFGRTRWCQDKLNLKPKARSHQNFSLVTALEALTNNQAMKWTSFVSSQTNSLRAMTRPPSADLVTAGNSWPLRSPD